MRARVLAVLIVLFTAAPIFPQCNFTPVLSDPFRSSILDLAVDGNDLWVATSYGVSLYDRSVDPPAIVATIPITGVTKAVRISGGNIYAASGNSIAVVRKSGSGLQVVRMVDAGAPVNDIVATATALYVATSKGLAQYNTIDFTNPLQVSQTAATSLALNGSNLYAAGGTPNIDAYIAGPSLQHTATIVAPAIISSVHANNTTVFASSAVQTYLVVNGSSAGTLPFSMTSLTPLAGNVIFAGSTDRTLRAIDVSLPGTPVELFRDDVLPSAGPINRVTSIGIAGGRAYVGAGDIGILDYDISGFNAPFPLRSVSFPGAASIVSLGDNFYAGLTSGIAEFTQTLMHSRTWDNSADTVQDGANGFLLTSSGKSVTLWPLLNNTTPIPAGAATFATAVSAAVLASTKVTAVLADGTVWSADLAQQTPAPVKIAGVQATSIARSGDAIAVAQNRSDGTTAVALLGGNSVSVPGLSTTPLTLSNTTAAVQTFRGISLIDLVNGTTTLLPNSNDVIAQELALSGNTLVELTGPTLRVWSTQSRTIVNEVTLPASGIAVSVAPNSTVADVVTASGVVTIALDRLARIPAAIPSPNANAFYTKVIASATRIGLIDARGVDLFTRSMQYVASIRGAGIVDFAASDNAIYGITGKLVLNAYTLVGSLMNSATINDPDTQATSLTAVRNSVWVSTVHCTAGTCGKNTIIYDNNLSRTISLTGAIVDLVVSGNRAYALTDTPNELRILDVTDSAHPSVISSIALTGTSLAYSAGTIYVLGNGLASYSETSLTKTADILTATSNPDEHIRIDGNCAILTGRDTSPQMFTVPQFAQTAAPAAPAAAHTLAVQPGTFLVLTDDSLEIWSTSPLPKAPRVRPAR